MAKKPRRGSTRTVSPVPERAPAPAAPDAYTLRIDIEEDEELSAHRFTVWLAPADEGRSGLHLCIGSGPTRAQAITDAEAELRGALTLLGKDGRLPPCQKCGWRPDA